MFSFLYESIIILMIRKFIAFIMLIIRFYLLANFETWKSVTKFDITYILILHHHFILISI